MSQRDAAFEARPSLPKLLLLFLAGVGFVIGGAWIAGLLGPAPKPGSEWVGWLSLVFFALCSVAIVKQMFDRTIRIRVDDQSIYYRGWRRSVRWNEVQDIHEIKRNGQRFICIKLKSPADFASNERLRFGLAINERLGFGDLAVNTVGTDRDFAALRNAVLIRWHRHRSA